MLEKVSQLAEVAATSVSRRQFLGRFGRGAMTVAAAAGGLLALPALSHGGRPVRSCGPESDFECQGRVTGDFCPGGGKCTSSRHFNGCYCKINGQKP